MIKKTDSSLGISVALVTGASHGIGLSSSRQAP